MNYGQYVITIIALTRARDPSRNLFTINANGIFQNGANTSQNIKVGTFEKL